MKKQIQQIVDFLKVGIWHVKSKDVPRWLYFFYSVLKKLLLAIERATTKRMVDSASALTYSTLLAIVPIMARERIAYAVITHVPHMNRTARIGKHR